MNKQLLPIIVGFLLFLLIFTYPAVFHLADRVIGDGGDNYQFLSFQYLGKLQLEEGRFPFGWTNYWRYPTGFNLAVGYDSTLLMLTGVLLYQFTANPVIVYNLSVLFFLFLSGFLSYFFFEKATHNSWLGFIGGVIYGFSFYNLARMGGHPNLVLTGCFPFFFYSLWQLWDRNGDQKSFILLSFSVILVFLSSLQYALILVGGLIIILSLSLNFYNHIPVSFLKLFWLRKKETFYSLAAILFVFLFFNGPRITGLFDGTFVLPVAETVSVPTVNYFLPNQYLKILPAKLVTSSSNQWIEYAVWFGFLEMVLFVASLFLTKSDKKLKSFLLCIAVIFFIFSFGGQEGKQASFPYSLLFNFLPYRGIIEPGRFYVFVYLVVTLMVVVFLKDFLKGSGKIWFILILTLIILERIPTGFYLSDTLQDGPFLKEVAASETKAVLDLPIFREWWHGQLYDLYSIYYGKPIVNGYIHWSGNTQEATFFLDQLKRFECSLDPLFKPRILDEVAVAEEISKNTVLARELRGYGIKIIVLHKDLSLREKQCVQAVENINIFLERSGLNFRKIFEDDKTVIYHLES